MCQTVVINRGEKGLGTPRQFLEHFGFMPILYEESYSEMDMDSCLCQADLDETFKQHNIPFKYDCMEYFVGQLELLSF